MTKQNVAQEKESGDAKGRERLNREPSRYTPHAIIARVPGFDIDNLSADIMEETLLNRVLI